MTIALRYIIAGLAFAGLALLMPHWLPQILLDWTALSLLVVSSAYWLNSAAIFRKRSDGSLPWYSRWLFIPFFLGTNAYNTLARRFDAVPAIQRISGDLYLGARLTDDELALLAAEGIGAVLDVTAEFPALDWATRDEDIQYLNIPVLDHASPTEAQLNQAVKWLHAQRAQQKKILVHCALGRGRSVLVLAAFLLSRNTDRSAEQAVALIKEVRHTANLNTRQLAALRKFAASYDSNMHTKAWLIANPVSGGGKWQNAEAEIAELLSPYMALTVKTTTPDLSARELAKQAKAAGANLVIACGGDGTVGEVAAELVTTNIALGIIPMGTTNALSHALWGISAKLMPVQSACINIIEGQSKTIDTARCNDHIMLILAGVGFAQQMIEAADRERKNELGQLAYLEGFWQAIQSNTMQPLRIQFDGQAEQVINTSSFIVANAAPITTLLAQGKGAPDMTDGQLDITWIPHNGDDSSAISSLAELAFTGLTQIALEDGNIRHCRAQRVQISADNEFKYVIDGELFSTHRLDIKILPASLRVMLPQAAEDVATNQAKPTTSR